jgi:hypothetical protein
MPKSASGRKPPPGVSPTGTASTASIVGGFAAVKVPVHFAPNGRFVAGGPTSVTLSSGDAATSIVASTSTGSELDAVTVHVVVDPRWISAGSQD